MRFRVSGLLLGVLCVQAAVAQLSPITIDYPAEKSIFPPDIAAPTFLWRDPMLEVLQEVILAWRNAKLEPDPKTRRDQNEDAAAQDQSVAVNGDRSHEPESRGSGFGLHLRRRQDRPPLCRRGA